MSPYTPSECIFGYSYRPMNRKMVMPSVPPPFEDPRPSSSIPSAPNVPQQRSELPLACELPSLQVDPATGIDPVLSAGSLSPSKTKFNRKPPHLDRRREYEANGNSHEAARSTVAMLSDRHRLRQVELEETFDRQLHADAFRTAFVEKRLATCGPPTLNTMDVRIARERERVEKHPIQPGSKKPPPTTDERVTQAIRHAYGSRVLDLKAMELVHIPKQVYSTLLLQLGRFISHVNVSRNSLREIPVPFIAAFREVTIFNCKENELDRLPEAMVTLGKLTELVAEYNQLRILPYHLPPTLLRVGLSRNRLNGIPHLHELTHLVELDLSHNHLQLLPPGMAFLAKLTKLVVSSNRLVTLALLPRFVHPEKKHTKTLEEDEGGDSGGEEEWTPEKIKQEQDKWRVETDPLTGNQVYFHLASRRVTRVKPRCFRANVPPLAIGKAARVTQQKKSHAHWLARFPDGWEVAVGGECVNGGVRDGSRPVTSSQASRPETSKELQSMELQFTHHLTEQTYSTLPPALDKWHELHRIQSLHLSGNHLVELPSSIGKLVRLQHLDVEHNKLQFLPDVFHELHALTTVKLAMNQLAWLPPSFCTLPHLTDLDLKLNRFKGLPEDIGTLTRLHSLDLSSNDLESLPRALLQLKKLHTIRLQGNDTLVKSGLLHADTVASGDLPQIRWYLSHQLLVMETHGGQQAPATHSLPVGVGDEVWSTNHHVRRAFTQAIERAQQSHTFDFHWKHLGFDRFPPSFFTSLGHLHELRLSGQNLDTIPPEFAQVCGSLRVLQLRKNRLRLLADSVFDCPGVSSMPMEELDLEYNQLEALPSSIGRLTALHTLRLATNHLTTDAFPSSFASLLRLRQLHVSHNRLTHPPPPLDSLASLETLDLSYNRLTTLETMAFASLTQLHSLRLSVNQLTDLPSTLALAPIAELHVAGNLLAELPSAILHLKHRLKSLKIQSNKITRLPLAFGEMIALEAIEADGNPLRSPPPEILRMGIASIQRYLLKRQQRVDEITRLLTAIRFPFNAEVFALPKLSQLLLRNGGGSGAEEAEEGSSGGADPMKFLTEKHLVAFESAVDSYVNGAFYLIVATRGADLVTSLLLQKQFFLAQRHREAVLRAFVKLLALVRHKKWLDKVDFRFDLDRPWSRRGERCAVYSVNPRALFDDTPQLPCVLSVVKKRVYHGFEDEAFAHTEAEVADALAHYVGVYGPVGVAHDDVPFACGCEALLRFNKRHEPCYRTGWTVVQVVYTAEEAERREAEEGAIADALAALRPQISTFLATKEGEKRFHKEVKVVKTRLRTELKAKKAKLKKLQKKLDKLKQALMKEEKEEAKRGLGRQKTLADVNERAEREERAKELAEWVKEGTAEYDKGKRQLGQGYGAFMDDVVTLLLEKVGAEVKNHLVKQHRQRAIEFGLRRPWDGPNGRDFEAYKLLVRRQMLSDGTMEKEESGGGAEGEEDRESTDNSEISDVSFDGYEDLVSNLAQPAEEEEEGESEEEDEEEEDAAVRAEALAKIEVSDVSDDDSTGKRDAKDAESEDSDL